jgi:RNA polymerase sigma factor (sigma-70 family)
MTDVEIVRLIRQNDPKGLSVLYSADRAEFLNWVIKLTGCNQDDAYEYYQATVLIVYDNIISGKLEVMRSSLKTYLFSVGKILILESKRNTDREEKIKAEYHLQLHVGEETDDDLDAEEKRLEVVARCLDKLGSPCRELLEVFYFNKKSLEEITAQFNYKNFDTTKNQKYKCMERLRKLVEEERLKESIE